MSDLPSSSGPWARPQHRRADVKPKSAELDIDFAGTRGALFWLALKTGVLTILTLGLYRFWMKTRLRRFYWSAIRPGGHPMEYVGTPLEKLLGFFIAVVILTFYIGIVNLILMFVSFAVFSSASLGYLASFAGVIPIWFYARYRARRYTLARTRWRGVRFGLEPGAWGYALRALWYWALTIVTCGILWPRMTFLLEKYRTDRTFFGSARLHQNGRWSMLFPATYPFLISMIALAAALAWLQWIDPLVEGGELDGATIAKALSALIAGETPDLDLNDPLRLFLIPVCMTGLLFGAIWYTWVARRIMANHKSADGIAFASALSGFRVTFIYVMGNFVAYVMLVLGVTVLVVIGVVIFAGDLSFLEGAPGAAAASALPRWLSVGLLAMLYLAFFLMWGLMYQIFVTFPLMRHMTESLTLTDISGLPLISQRARDTFAEAEGFAEALDVGAAI